MFFPRCLTLSLGLILAGSLPAVPLAECFKVETIAFPSDIPAEVGAIGFDAQGTLYAVLRRGDVLTAKPAKDPQGFAWRLFATGFDNAAGIAVMAPGRVLVAQMGELTEAMDTDGDGQADRYRTVVDDWGLSGNYHEANSVCPDGKGGYYLSLGTASYNGPTFVHTKGEYSRFGRRGRNFSAVKNRGWTMHLTADGKFEPFASGFRMQNGLMADDEGNLWSSDNQGDWKATTPFYHVRSGHFYGHPSSLVWDPKWPAGKDPIATYRADLAAYNAHRTYAAVEIPHPEICRSGSEPIQIPRNGSFGAFGGQMLLPDEFGTRIARIILEKVDGEFQGAVTLFMDGFGLRTGNNRVRFSPDGHALYVGQTVRGWGKPSEGIQRITWLGGIPFTVETMRITPTGFRITFTAPINDAGRKSQNYAVRSMIYQSRWTYGSDPEDQRDEVVSRVAVIDERTVEIALESFRPGRVYRLSLGQPLASAAHEAPAYRDFYYTANRIPTAR